MIFTWFGSSIAASGSSTSEVVRIDRDEYKNACVHYSATGSGTYKIDFEYSVDGSNWQANTTSFKTGLTSSAAAIENNTLILATYCRIKLTETGGASTVTPTLRVRFAR